VYTGEFRQQTFHLRTDDPKAISLSLPDIEMSARVQRSDSDPSIVVLTIDETKTGTTQEYLLPATANVANVFPGQGFTGLIYFYPLPSTVEAQLYCSADGRPATRPMTNAGRIRCDVTGPDASGPRTESVQVVGSTSKKITFGTNTVGITGLQEFTDQGISIVLQFVPHPPMASEGVEGGEVFRQLLQLPPSVSNHMPGPNGLSGRFVLHAEGGDISFGCTAE
jgi:hypothetical protein